MYQNELDCPSGLYIALETQEPEKSLDISFNSLSVVLVQPEPHLMRETEVKVIMLSFSRKKEGRIERENIHKEQHSNNDASSMVMLRKDYIRANMKKQKSPRI